MPIMWRHHMKAALAVFLAYNAALLPSVVDTLMCSPTSRVYVQQLYKALDAAAFSVGGILLPFHGSALPDAAPRAQAYALVVWLQVVLGVLVPSVYLYCHEIRWVGLVGRPDRTRWCAFEQVHNSQRLRRRSSCSNTVTVVMCIELVHNTQDLRRCRSTITVFEQL